MAGGVGDVELKNGNGVILQLHRVKVRAELSVNLVGVNITVDRAAGI
jgi:hypothetical protein